MMELSLPTAVFSAFIGSSVLLMALIYVSTTPGAPKGLSWWIAGMAMCCIRYATVYWFLATRLPAAIFLAESLQVMSAIALAAGGVEFLGRRVSKIHFAAISAVAVAWAAYTTLVYPNFLLRTIPLYFTSGILLILVGVAFLRAQPTGQRSGYALTGILFMAWGLHKLDFPFLRPIQWFAPYGFLIAMILLMALAVSLIVIVQRRMLHVTENEVRERQEAEAALSASERRFQRLFENSEVSLWNEDFSQACEILAKIRQEGVEDLRAYLVENEQAVAELIGSVKVLNVNEATLKLFSAKNEADLVENIQSTWGPGARDVFIDEMCAIWDGQKVFRSEAAYCSLGGKNIDATISYQIPETEQGFSSIPVSIIDITERKRAHNLLRDAIESLGEGFALWDKDDRFVLCNEKYRRSMTGLEDILEPGLPFDEMLHTLVERRLRPEAIGREDEWIKERLEKHGKPGTSFEIQTADGAWIEIHEFGTSEGGVVTVRNDITDRKQADADAQRKAGEELALGNLLRLSIGSSALNAYLQDSIETLLDSVPWLNLLPSGGIFLAESDEDDSDILRLVAHHNFDARLVDLCADIPFGKCHCGMAALTREVQYSSCVDGAHEISYEGIEQHGHYNVPILHNGAVLGVIVLYLPHEYPMDDLSVTFLKRVADVLSMGISARRTAQALGETEGRFRTIVNNCPFAIFLKDPDGRYLFGNTEFLKWHAADNPATVVGKTSMEQFDAPDAAEMMEQDRVVLETRDVDVRQVVRKYRDDVTRHLLAIKFPILDDAGDIASIGCVDVDITRLKETENELKLAMEEAERANRAKSEFLASMSHELRTPLNAVLGFAQMLQFNAKHPLTEDQNRQVEHILEGGGHLLDLVNEILDLAKIEGDQLTLSLEEVDATEIVADCMVLAVPLGEQKHITIVNEFEDSDPVILRTDPLRLKQALLNLLSNAIKFNQDSGKVTMSGRILDDGFLHIAVTDTGVGIEEADKLNVFQMFHRLGADPTLTREGTGIGLTVTKHLVERLAGRIGFESEKGVGSTFWIDLPLARNENVLIWTETMQIGIDAIDKDHKHLISLLNRLSHGLLEDVDTDHTIQELIEYTRYHFRREEMIMDLGGYPGRDEHRLQHRALSADMAALAKRWSNGRDQATFTELKSFLRNWLFEHIMKTDAEIRTYAKGKADELLPAGADYDSCLACGLCASGCPATGFHGMDPRRFIRMAMLGMNEELSNTPWIWTCTQCKRCTYLCPMSIDVAALVGYARGVWPKEKKPQGIVRSCEAQMKFPSTSAMGVMPEDFVEIVEEVADELRDEDPRFADIEAPMDRKGATYFVNQNSREPAVEPEELAPLWKIFDYVGADWTYASKGWAAENFCMFTGDDTAWKAMVEERVNAVNELGCQVWVNTECGHSFFTLWKGVERFGLKADFEAESLVSLYARWIREGKLPVNADWNTENLKFTVQDPCQLVRKSIGDPVADDLRFVAKHLVGEHNFVDMFPNRSANYCCGGGAGFLQAGMTEHRRAYGKRKYEQIAVTEADYVLTPCHNCHTQIEDLGEHYGGRYRVIHFWTLICLSLGILGPNERKYLGPELAQIGL